MDHAKQSAAGALETASKRTIENTAEAAGDLINYKITETVVRSYNDKLPIKISRTLPQNTTEAVSIGTKERS